jgi:hypothetical protein
MENKDFFDKGDFTTLDKETSFNKWFSIEEAKNLHIEPSITKELFDKTELNHDVIVEE